MKPPSTGPQQVPPLKQHQPFGMMPPDQEYATFNVMPNMTMPESVSLYTDSPDKRMSLPTSQPLMAGPPMNPQPMYAPFDLNYPQFEQENFQMPMPMPENFADFPDPSHMRRAPLKRSYSESIATNDRPFKKAKAEQVIDEEYIEIPQPEDMPPVEDNGLKPPYSYAHMIGMAILRAPGRKLTLANIYDWIATTFKFYRDDPKTGWHNSIRHNLSLNKAFIKQERPKSDAGKGCYWVIQPGMEASFFKEKPRKNNSNANNLPMQQSFSSQPTLQAMAQPVAEAIQPRPWVVQSQPALPSEPISDHVPPRPQTAPALPELSSDATLPASDPALNEDELIPSKEIPELAPPSMGPPPSSPPIINSSPPVASHHVRTRSSPTHIAQPGSKRRGMKPITGMDDSGYFSSIESSARASRHRGVMPTSELGFENLKTKRGRAELEIARIRSSSHDVTPSNVRFKNVPVEPVRSSSPEQESPAKDPTTPSVVFKKPQLPPQSVSPNTQLRRHREAMQQMIGSPVKQDDVFGNFEIYSPTFKLGTPYGMTSFDDSFLYEFTNPTTPIASSPTKATPTKRSAQRSSYSGVLSDVTKRVNGKLNSKTPSKISNNITFKAPAGASFPGSPLKKSMSTKHDELFNDENENALFDFNSFPDENSEDGEELDISKGFSKIGSGSSLMLGKPLGGLKPPLARSQTTRF